MAESIPPGMTYDPVTDTLSVAGVQVTADPAVPVASIAVPVAQTRDDTLLGASEAAAVLGLDKYRSPMSVWLAKRAARAGERLAPEDRPDFVREAAEWGQVLEPVIRGKYALTTGRMVYVPQQSIATPPLGARDGLPDSAWLRCTPDGFVIGGANPANGHSLVEECVGGFVPADAVGLLQVKTCSAYKADEWTDGVPPAYEVQVRVEMAVCQLPWCDVVCLVGGQRYVGPFRIHRDVNIESNILTDLRAFWQHVLDGTPPPVDASEAWHRHASSQMKHGSKLAIEADDDCRAFLVELRQARIERKRAEKQETELKNQILLRLGAASATVLDGGDLGKISAFPNPARMDWKGYAEYLEHEFRAAMPGSIGELVTRRDRFKGTSSGWQIRTPRDWSDEE